MNIGVHIFFLIGAQRQQREREKERGSEEGVIREVVKVNL